MNGLDRQCSNSFTMIVESVAGLHVQDNEFWETVEAKLVDERLYRQLNLKQMATVLHALGEVGRGSDQLIELLEKSVIKHRKALTDDLSEKFKDSFRALNKGSEVLYAVLEDKDIELPAIEA